MDKFVQIDIFGLSVFIERNSGEQILYTIEPMDDSYYCHVKKRNSKVSRWSKKRFVTSSKNYIKFEYADNDVGFKLHHPEDLSLKKALLTANLVI